MSVERYLGWAWLCCNHEDCEAETDSIEYGDRKEAEAEGRREGWSVGEDAGQRGVDYCPKHIGDRA